MSLEAAVDQEKFFSIFELRQILAVPRCRGHLLSWVHLFLVRSLIYSNLLPEWSALTNWVNWVLLVRPFDVLVKVQGSQTTGYSFRERVAIDGKGRCYEGSNFQLPT